jgi:hypothetical protein
MRDEALFRLSGFTAIVGGILTAIFWLMTFPLGTFVGAEVAQHSLWIPSQLLHVLGALLALFGFTGMYLAERHAAGRMGALAFFLIISGTVLFLVDGVIALAVFPALATIAPDLLAPTGAMNQGLVLTTFIVCAVVNMLGNIAFAIVTMRAAVFPRIAAAMLLVGGVLFNLPPGPVPLPVLAVGGLIWAIALTWCGTVLLGRGMPAGGSEGESGAIA